jgi:hypothetical protein
MTKQEQELVMIVANSNKVQYNEETNEYSLNGFPIVFFDNFDTIRINDIEILINDASYLREIKDTLERARNKSRNDSISYLINQLSN